MARASSRLPGDDGGSVTHVPRSQRPARWLANGCYAAAAAGYLPVLSYQMVVQGKNRRGWRQRFGGVPRRAGERACVWIHGVSLGEINATRQLITRLAEVRPDVEVVVSSTTDTGYARARALYPDLAVLRFPLDFSWVVSRVLERLRPSLIVLMELELWYNLVTLASERGVPVCVANGRFTARSSRRLERVARLARPMFERLSWVGAQTPEIAARFAHHGVPSRALEVAGSMKWDTAVVGDDVDGAAELAEAMGLDGSDPVIVLGSSGPGEERLVLEAWTALNRRLASTLVVVPRKPERFDEVARMLQRDGHTVLRRSATPDGSPAPDTRAPRVLLGDTMGELRKFYACADVVVVGRSLVPMGGSDPMEVAALGKPIVVGPHTANFADPVDQLQRAGALAVVNDAAGLTERLEALLSTSAQARRDIGHRGQDVVRRNQGASERTVQRIVELLPAGHEVSAPL